MNFLNQVRALPNPSGGHTHPLTLHLTSTSTANITITSLTPTPPNTQPFVKISPNAEVIVAPKTRSSSRPSSVRDSRSVASNGRKSVGGRSTTSGVRSKTPHDSEKARPPLFLRGVSRQLRSEWFDDNSEEFLDEGLKIWVDPEHLLSKTLRGVTWVTQARGSFNPPECDLNSSGVVGGIVRIDCAPQPLPRTASALKEPSQQASKDAIVKRLRVTPFAQSSAEQKSTGFRFGGESKTEREESAQRLRAIFGRSLLEGPLTDGMYLPPRSGWPGGIVDFDSHALLETRPKPE
ncbi:hypothetical protein MRB53_039468 [Persea americana]|nr:hypothetical protein MRB53_039468 [Persea americana]